MWYLLNPHFNNLEFVRENFVKLCVAEKYCKKYTKHSKIKAGQRKINCQCTLGVLDNNVQWPIGVVALYVTNNRKDRKNGTFRPINVISIDLLLSLIDYHYYYYRPVLHCTSFHSFIQKSKLQRFFSQQNRLFLSRYFFHYR